MDELRADDPRWIGTYRLLGRLGTGGMGRVYLARSERGRTVAVKLVRAELAEQEEFRTRFRREVRAARRVGGRWTAPVLDADTEAEIPWVATGYVAGPSLQQVVARDHGPLPEPSVRVLASGLAHALADIHAAGLVHRDLKPSNVMITIDGPRVIDFGIARALETVADDGEGTEGTEGAVTYTGAMVGSPAFMSPEQVRGDRIVTPACDIFCLGSVLAFAATGLQPFGAASSGVHAQMFRIVQEPPDLDAVPDGLRDLVAACLVKDPQERPSLAEVQERIGAGGAVDATGPAGEPWLPGAIVAQLGRQAVRLLELEAAETGSLPVVSLADAPSARTRVQTAPAGQAPRDTHGTRDTRASSDAPSPVVPRPRAEPWPAPASAAAPAAVQAAGPGTGSTAAPQPGTAYPPSAAGAPVPPHAATAPHLPPGGPAAAPPRRGRRGALIAVVVLLAVIAGTTTALVALRAGDHGGSGPRTASSAPATTAKGGGTTAATPPATATPSGPGGPGGPGGVPAPADLVGTWHAAFDSGQGENDRTLTVHADGSVVLTGDSTSGGGYDCAWSMHVTSAGPPTELSASVLTRGEPAGACLPGETTSLTLVDATHLRRDNLESGKAPLTYERTG
ncbi:Serine/threonine protein kinase [Actinacidiphila rubida]|uniref:Serine/threonine protein kinase n=2 Tax=Actinacidiphila rubida TaxID=310780 RepID=A0A1H8TEI4_9ACTN|nr:serine/threonine-protein kinase [Actinacidiphila rubida]SEO88908.1 Serine/threonine protein kinase [Actinacidiphila rubida]